MARAFSAALGLEQGRIQFTPDLMPADITGTTVLSQDQDGTAHLRFQAGPVFANLVLADEINRAAPRTQSALLEAMQERHVTIGTVTHDLPDPFVVLATQNPIEMAGTYPLPEAELDRFLFKLEFSYPTRDELNALVTRTAGLHSPAELEPVANPETLLAMSALAREVPAATPVVDYASRLVLALHPAPTRPPTRCAATCARARARGARRRWCAPAASPRCSTAASRSPSRTFAPWPSPRCATA